MQESAGLGALLRECREARGVLLDDLSRATRIVPRQLLALEEDRLRDLPAPVFVRGFIRSYCAALAEPPERALTLYEAWVAAVEPAPVRVPATVLAEAPGPRGLRWRFLAPPLVAAGLLVVIGGAVYLLASSAATRLADPPRPTEEAPGPGALLGRTPGAAVVPAPREAGGHVLVARVHEPTWVSVRPDDGAARQELLDPGTVREWRSAGPFTVTVGNAGGLTLELDGVALPPLGDRGQVLRDLRIPREPVP